LRTPEEIAENEHWTYIIHIDREKRSRELCMIAIRKCKFALAYVPRKYEDVYQAWKIIYN